MRNGKKGPYITVIPELRETGPVVPKKYMFEKFWPEDYIKAFKEAWGVAEEGVVEGIVNVTVRELIERLLTEVIEEEKVASLLEKSVNKGEEVSSDIEGRSREEWWRPWEDFGLLRKGS